jgi:hypothetical protein
MVSGSSGIDTSKRDWTFCRFSSSSCEEMKLMARPCDGCCVNTRIGEGPTNAHGGSLCVTAKPARACMQAAHTLVPKRPARPTLCR